MMRFPLAAIALILLIAGCDSESGPETTPATVAVAGEGIRIEFDDRMYSRVVASLDGNEMQLGRFVPSEYVVVGGEEVTDFAIGDDAVRDVTDAIGAGKRHTLTGTSGSLRKNVAVTTYDNFPTMAVFEVTYVNEGDDEISIDRWVNNHYAVRAGDTRGDAFWSYQSGSYSRRPDWILPVNAGFDQENYLGMNASDYGGGTPVVDLWHRDAGVAVGHLEMAPKLVSLPIRMADSNEGELQVQFDREVTLAPGDSLKTFRTFVNVHKGDYYTTLENYRGMMIAQGLEFPDVHADAYEPQWCAWGYEREFTMDQVYGTLPKVKELDYHWVVLDDGWQTNVGDWELHPDKYPSGDADMIAFVDRVEQEGFRSKLWWAPMAVHPESNLYKEHPEYLLLDENGDPVDISWWNSYYLCPAYGPVREYTNRLVDTIIGKWGYEGLKLDGQHLNAAPRCYNPAHNHEYPEESVEAVSAFFSDIYRTATAHVPDALIELCPCGTAYSFHTMPFMTQGVASDPTSSWQVRHKGKTLKALMGPSTPYYGDHVELTTTGTDFASQVGVGAVIGTKFTWPLGAMDGSSAELTPEREQEWEKWSRVYAETRLAEGTYRGELYDIGFDMPEAHAIEKDGRMYYAFYSGEREGDNVGQPLPYEGTIEIRGLGQGNYAIRDYENGRDLGVVTGPSATLDVSFDGHLLILAEPADQAGRISN